MLDIDNLFVTARELADETRRKLNEAVTEEILTPSDRRAIDQRMRVALQKVNQALAEFKRMIGAK